MNNLNCLERVQKSDDEEKKCCPSNRDDDTPICAPLSQSSDKMCGSMEFADIDKDTVVGEFETFADGLNDSSIHLMRDEHRDIFNVKIALFETFIDQLNDPTNGHLIHLASVDLHFDHSRVIQWFVCRVP